MVYPQDCAVLGDIVAASPDDLDTALERYERQRKPDVHALATMDHQARAHHLDPHASMSLQPEPSSLHD